MAATTTIEWTDATWNALRGCSKVSAGCANCYAVGMAARFCKPGLWGHGLVERTCGGPRWTGTVVLDEKALMAPLHWQKPRRIFVTSGSDPFHPAVTDEMLDRLFAVMAEANWHTFQLLTKRPERMREYCMSFVDRHQNEAAPGILDRTAWPLPNLWLGVSVEDQASADQRVPHLLATPAAKRFFSCEPLLGPVDILVYGPNFETVDWVIVGGESGPKARPMHPDWARNLRDQCANAGVPFFFKRWGRWAPFRQEDLEWFSIRKAAGAFKGRRDIDDSVGWPMQSGKMKATGHLLDGMEYREVPK